MWASYSKSLCINGNISYAIYVNTLNYLHDSHHQLNKEHNLPAFIKTICSLLFGRFVNVLDILDTRVEKLRKEALNLAETRDLLHMSMDILKNNELLTSLDECKYLKFCDFCLL